MQYGPTNEHWRSEITNDVPDDARPNIYRDVKPVLQDRGNPTNLAVRNDCEWGSYMSAVEVLLLESILRHSVAVMVLW